MATLTVPERATITNMGAECGVTTSIFPSDSVTRAFLVSQGRAADWVELLADNDAVYDRTVDIDFGGIVPLAATPHSPGNIATVASFAGMAVDQVCIGSCTNSSYKDLATVARILKGRVVAPAVSLIMAPGSRQALQNIEKDGYLADLLASGVRLDRSACGFCIGNCRSPASGGVSLRTSNRNFEGRCGTKDARVYLVACETAAAAAITGVNDRPAHARHFLSGSRDAGTFLIDDGCLLFR